MSVIVMANYKGETFEVEIFRDGGIDFPDRDFQYDQAVAEFAPPGPATVQLYELWKKSPIGVIDKNLKLPENSGVLLVADYAEHVLHICEDKYPNDHRPRKAIEATRKFAKGKIKLSTIKKAQAAAWAVRLTLVRSVVDASDASVWAAARAAEGAARSAAWAAEGAATQAADTAARAAAYHVSSDSDSVAWQQASNAEFAWQIRRFVDCMEAIGRGKDWPDLEATK